MIENIRVALLGIRSNKLRSALTMLGITIGVAAVIVLVSLGQAVDNFVRQQFLGIGTNLLIVFAQADDEGVLQRLTSAEADALADPFRVPDALYVMPQRQVTTNIKYGDREISGRILGVTEVYLEIRNRFLVDGQFFTLLYAGRPRESGPLGLYRSGDGTAPLPGFRVSRRSEYPNWQCRFSHRGYFE